MRHRRAPPRAGASEILLDKNPARNYLSLKASSLRIGGAVEGYAYGGVLPGGAFDVMVLKGNLDFRFVARPSARARALPRVDKATYLNLEEDLGLPGLRENKLSQPCASWKSTKAAALALPRQKNCARSVNRRATVESP